MGRAGPYELQSYTHPSLSAASRALQSTYTRQLVPSYASFDVSHSLSAASTRAYASKAHYKPKKPDDFDDFERRQQEQLHATYMNGIEKSPLPPSLQTVRQKYNMTDHIFDHYWKYAAGTQLKGTYGRVIKRLNISSKARRKLRRVIEQNNVQDAISLGEDGDPSAHLRLMLEAKEIFEEQRRGCNPFISTPLPKVSEEQERGSRSIDVTSAPNALTRVGLLGDAKNKHDAQRRGPNSIIPASAAPAITRVEPVDQAKEKTSADEVDGADGFTIDERLWKRSIQSMIEAVKGAEENASAGESNGANGTLDESSGKLADQSTVNVEPEWKQRQGETQSLLRDVHANRSNSVRIKNVETEMRKLQAEVRRQEIGRAAETVEATSQSADQVDSTSRKTSLKQKKAAAAKLTQQEEMEQIQAEQRIEIGKSKTVLNQNKAQLAELETLKEHLKIQHAEERDRAGTLDNIQKQLKGLAKKRNRLQRQQQQELKPGPHLSRAERTQAHFNKITSKAQAAREKQTSDDLNDVLDVAISKTISPSEVQRVPEYQISPGSLKAKVGKELREEESEEWGTLSDAWRNTNPDSWFVGTQHERKDPPPPSALSANDKLVLEVEQQEYRSSKQTPKQEQATERLSETPTDALSALGGAQRGAQEGLSNRQARSKARTNAWNETGEEDRNERARRTQSARPTGTLSRVEEGHNGWKVRPVEKPRDRTEVPNSRPEPSNTPDRASDQFRLNLPPSGELIVDSDLTISVNSNTSELQNQIFQLHQRLRASFPSISHVPYNVWESGNRKTLQTWLKILVKRWQTRFDDVKDMSTAVYIDQQIGNVLEHMVRDHELSHEAAKRVAIKWMEVFSRRGDMAGDAEGTLDWDELHAGGMGFLQNDDANVDEVEDAWQSAAQPETSQPQSKTIPIIQPTKRPTVSSEYETFTKRLYSAASRPPLDSSNGSKPAQSASPSSSNPPLPSSLPHLTPTGSAHMVSVSSKPHTIRTAIAVGTVYFSNPTPLSLIKSNSLKKGDVLSVSRIAGIMAAKKCPDLIPLCHPIPLTHVAVELRTFNRDEGANLRVVNENGKGVASDDMSHGGVQIEAKISCTGPTGVEMEALTSVMGTALSVVDMCKAVDKCQRIGDVRVVVKEGGKSGVWREEGWGSWQE